jgi:hypothetical protein
LFSATGELARSKQVLLRPIAGTEKLFPVLEFDTPMPPVFSPEELTMPGSA